MSPPIFGGLATLMPSGNVAVQVNISPTFTYQLDLVMNELRQRNPKASDAQLLDEIFVRGLLGVVNDYNLPRRGAHNQD